MINDYVIVDAVAIQLGRIDLAIGMRFKQEFYGHGPWHAAPNILRKLTSYWEMKFYNSASALFMDTPAELPSTDDPILWLNGFARISLRAASTIHWS
jgi:hypothetical protein